MFLEPNRCFTLKMYSDARDTYSFWCQLSPTSVLRCVNISSSYVGTSNRRPKLPDTRKNCNSMYSLQHFPQRAQSITAEAVLPDKAQTCQPSAEELLATDNHHREQSTATASSNRGSHKLFACCLRSNCWKGSEGSAFVGTCAWEGQEYVLWVCSASKLWARFYSFTTLWHARGWISSLATKGNIVYCLATFQRQYVYTNS
jgi:hypothetical protein